MKKEKKYTLQEVAEIVDSEGLEYAICHYMDSDSIADKKLAKKWDEARKVLNEIEEMLPKLHE